MTLVYNLSVVLVAAICTFFTRLFPFALFGRHQEPPQLVKYLGNILPRAVMAILIIFCLKGMTFNQISGFVPLIIGVIIVALLHIWKRNNLISIGVGTVCYMFMIQIVFK